MDDMSWWQELGFLCDLCGYLNKLNVTLQGTSRIVTEMRDVLAFQNKIRLFKAQLFRKFFQSFPTLELFCAEDDPSLNIEKYISYLDILSKEFKEKFSDLDALCDKFSVFVSPFSADPINNEYAAFATELIDLKSNSVLGKEERRLQIAEFWGLVAKTDKFPILCNFVAKLLSMLSTTYECEKSFSLMNLIKSSVRSRLSDSHLSSCLRIMSSQKLSPDISSLIKNKKRCQKSTQAD